MPPTSEPPSAEAVPGAAAASWKRIIGTFATVSAAYVLSLWVAFPGYFDPLRVLTRFVLKYTLRAAHLELGGVDLDLAVEEDVVPPDRADMG